MLDDVRLSKQIDSEVSLSRTWHAFLAVAVASGFINLLHLTGSLFMLEVYDRILPSKSIPSLIALCVLVLLLYGFQIGFDVVRGQMLTRVADILDQQLEGRMYKALLKMPFSGEVRGDGLQALSDLDQIRGFLSSNGPNALFDFPWLPFYLLICFMLHPWIGVSVLIGAAVLVVIALLTNWSTATLNEKAANARGQRNMFASGSVRNAEAIQAMGMSGTMMAIWRRLHGEYKNQSRRGADIIGAYGAASRAARMIIQSGVMAVGAVLVVSGDATAGSIIAGSILSAKALAPVEQAIGNWRSFTSARQGWSRLQKFFEIAPETEKALSLPRPAFTFSVENLTGAPPGGSTITLADVSFELQAGNALGVIGPSASGKSTLARLIVGAWPIRYGKVRFDGANLDQWDMDELGQHLGYLPQTVELMAGTVAQNIARFQPDATPASIIDAAKAANVHDLILNLPEGYKTKVGPNGDALSAGQRQRIALARALYGEPFLVILDEPNSNLDAEGENALSGAIANVRARGGIVIVIAHRPSALSNVDLVAVIAAGRLQRFGTKEEIFGQVLRQNIRPVTSDHQPRVIEDAGSSAAAKDM
ncbi:type I secretion system permease/ATPase [Rhizobium sp. GCM10022189]|uniref:type I secretion system permease/ATPase n=1 Tax=Rhizobium sp. GCM10022189 TaxID=3252654 RepID=UPI00360DFED6